MAWAGPAPCRAGAIVLARAPRVVYGALDPKTGAAGSVLDVFSERRLNHRPDVAGGCGRGTGAVLRAFFASRR
ncbi:MAG: deaminase [Thermoleophilaceae bacterium]